MIKLYIDYQQLEAVHSYRNVFLSLAVCTSSQEWTLTQAVLELHLVRT